VLAYTKPARPRTLKMAAAGRAAGPIKSVAGRRLAAAR
jgi:hypothetical protein